MKYCNHCASELELRVPDGDSVARYICSRCDSIHYTNPKVVVGSIPETDGRILLCKRAIEPRYGLWTLPAGFLEDNETTIAGAARETLEEACARVDIAGLFALFNLPHVNQVYIMFRASLRDLDFAPGTESLAVDLYREEEVPWAEIAFPVIEQTLRLYFADRRRGSFDVHTGDIVRLPGPGRAYETRMLGDR